ncbi:MAG: hypothetical protein QOJ07_2522, partial [Thermoleophilaceae bacterium]|nr:hypothetical protein [Thermoleophilaceae bacterium]
VAAVAAAARRRAAKTPRFELIDGCPVPRALAGLVHTIKSEVPGATLVSCYRGDDVADMLHAHGKHTQREIYEMFVHNPALPAANPPDRGSHILRGDGTVGKLFAKLRPEQCGMDWDDPHIVAIKSRALKHGWVLTQPYFPRQAKEFHHLNATKWSRISFVPEMSNGSRGPQVVVLTRRLRYVTDKDRKPYFAGRPQATFDGGVETAVKHFQRDHKLVDDGIVGQLTWKQLISAVRFRKKNPLGGAAQPETDAGRVGAAHHNGTSKPLNGIDVAIYQRSVDWKRVKASGSEFAFCKATEGMTLRDQWFSEQRWKEMADAGLARGAYHLARPGNQDPPRRGRDEARFFVKTVQDAGGWKADDLAPALDIEYTKLDRKGTSEFVLDFVKEVERLVGCRPIIYTGGPFWKEHVDWSDDHGCPLWLAAYVDRDAVDRFVPRAWKRWSIWQYSNAGHPAGVANPPCDVDVTRTGLRGLRVGDLTV